MTKRLLVILALLGLAETSAFANTITILPLLSLQFTIGGEVLDIKPEYSNIGGDIWTTRIAVENTKYKLDLTATFNPDPFVTYAYGVQNFTSAPMTFMFVFTTPYVDGPYNNLESTHSDSFTNFA